MCPDEWSMNYGDMTRDSSREILPPLLNFLGEPSFIGVGCGNGHGTLATIDARVEGFEGSRPSLLLEHKRFDEAIVIGLSLSNYARVMGAEGGLPFKFLHDLSLKIAKKLKT